MPKPCDSSSSSSSSNSETEDKQSVKAIAKRAKLSAQKAVYLKFKAQRALKAESKRDPTCAPVYYIETLAALTCELAEQSIAAATASYSTLKHYDLDEELHAGGRDISLRVADSLSPSVHYMPQWRRRSLTLHYLPR